MPFTLNITYRLAGNLFSNLYYLPDATVEAAESSAAGIQAAQAALQTPDVEYVTAILTDREAPYASRPVTMTAQRGTVTSLPTMPAITFLEFVFLPSNSRGKTTHRIRGCAANDITDLGVFSVFSGGRGDYDNGSGGPIVDNLYVAYVTAVGNLSVDRNNNALYPSERVSVGAKRATARL